MGGQAARLKELHDGNFDSYSIKTLLQLAYNDNIKLDVPTGTPPFEADAAPKGCQPAGFKSVIKRIGNCLTQGVFPAVKKESIFIGILESVHPEDAKIIIAAKDKKLDKLYPKVSKNLVDKIWPELL